MRGITRRRIRIFLAAATVGTCLQAISPQGCTGLIQQNVESLLRFNNVVGPEVYQSWIWKVLNRG